MLIEEAVMPGTPGFVVESYKTLAERAKTREFGLIEQDVVVLDTETTGLSVSENELIEISAARLRGREIVESFDTFVKPHGLIPPEITELTSITNADVAGAPGAVEAVAALKEFVGGAPVIAHNASFDRSFIEAVKGGVGVSDVWIDSLALSRIALPRLSSHRLAFIADVFGCSAVSHRANADVEALCGVWHILLVALSDLPQGLCKRLADMYPDVPWAYRPVFSYLAAENPGAVFSLAEARSAVLSDTREPERCDADELPGLSMPEREEIEDAYAPGGLVNKMYAAYEPRQEQITMACEIRDALETSTHRVIEAGTGVGKSIAYLLPFAYAAKRNNITVGVATKSNNLTDQLMNHELPKLAAELPGGLSYCALKGFDHYPCLRKLEHMSRSVGEIKTRRDPADTLTAIAVIYAYVCQSADGDLDALGIRWKSVNRQDLTSTSRECARRLCPFFPNRCLVHGARRRASSADIVVTNHSLLFRNVAADGHILPPIRHWVVDEAHSIEAEARKQWAKSVSADESRLIFERLGSDKQGALGQVAREFAASDAAALYLGLVAKANASAHRASLAMADLFEGVRFLSRKNRGSYDSASLWIGPELRESASWQDFEQVASAAADALDQADRNVSSLVSTVGAEFPEKAVDLADLSRRLHEMKENLSLILDGKNKRYVYSLQVNRRIRASGEQLSAELLDIGEAFAEDWLPELHTGIFASATVAVSESFEHFNHAIGLDRSGVSQVKDLQLDSSYSFDDNMAVVVARDLPDPRDRAAYIEALSQLLVDVHLAMDGSVLTLFTNRKDMEDAYDNVAPQLQKYGLELNCQQRNSSPRRLREHFIAEEKASLFALKAFWEGFDATGSTLRCVVIPKLPFSSPTDPLSCERNAREQRAWARYALPDAVLSVKQAAGRLIRSSTDSGVLVLADSRLMTKSYGKKFLSSLPTSSYQSIEANKIGQYLQLWRSSHEKKGPRK